MEEQDVDRRSASLVEASKLIMERWWVILIAVVLCAGLAFGLAKHATKEYQATATLLTSSSGNAALAAINPALGASSADPQRQQSTTLLLITSGAVAQRVAKALKLPDPPAALAGEIVASANPDADLISVTATDPDPQRAANLANGFAVQYQAFQQDLDRQGFTEGIADLTEQISKLPTSATTQRAQLESELQQLQVAKSSTNGGVTVISPATVPSSPSSPRPTRNLILGAILGLALGVAFAFALDLFDRRLKTVAAMERAYSLPALTSVPLQVRPPRTDQERVTMLEPFRILRSGLTLLDPGEDVHVVMVTSAVAGEGKSQVAVGLATALGVAGLRVVLVEVDLRRPSMYKKFDLGDDKRGLTNAIVSGIPISELTRPIVRGLPNLCALPSGSMAPNSAELLRSGRMTRILEELRESFDAVVLDAPPLLPVADSHDMLDRTQIDACLVVGYVGKTTREQAARTRSILSRHRLTTLGLVVNGVHHNQVNYGYFPDPDPELVAPVGRPD